MRAPLLFSIASVFAVAAACGSKDQPKIASSVALSQQAAGPAASSPDQVNVGSVPTNDCDWIPAADVEAVVGKLTAPPHEGEDGCVYTLPIPQSVLDKRATLDKVRAGIARMPGGDTSLLKAKRYDTYGFVLDVQLKEDGSAEKVANAVGSILADAAGADDTANTASAGRARTSPRGWDAAGMPYGGRIGHIRVSLRPLASDFELPRDKLDTLGAHIRDRIPDRPFAFSGSSQSADNDPCTLLTRQEAEAVLGPLLVAPYRTANDGPLAYATGPSCGYYTAGHHVLVLTPHWTRGKFEFSAHKGIGGLIATVSKDNEALSADTLEGPWDEATMSSDGRLVLLKGDRALEVGYRVSSAGVAGALKLARLALPRLAAANVKQ